jgi:hypothetical protein
MKRRELFYSLLGVSCLPAFVQAQKSTPAPGDEIPSLALTTPDAVASGILHFFSLTEFPSFRRFGDAIMPAAENEPGALDARAPEFLDFLLAESPVEIQTLYRNGVRDLDRKATQSFKSSFSKLGDTEISKILAPLSDPWTHNGPTDPFAQFLQAGKMAFWQATVNSREWAQAKSAGRRSAAGLNTYWLPIE